MGLTERRAFTTPNFPRDPIVLSVEHDADVVPLRTGCRLWSASYALVDHLSTRAHERVLDKRVLELGAGVGACGLACASLGARAVCLTDRDEATLALAHANARRNGWFDGDARANACEVTVRRLDWSDSTTYAREEETYDVVVAADMLYLEEHVEDLANAVDAHAGVDGTFIAAFGVRRRELTERFVDALRARGMTVTMTPMMCVNEEMRMTAEEHEHDDEIASRGGYALLEAARERGAEAADAEALRQQAAADLAAVQAHVTQIASMEGLPADLAAEDALKRFCKNAHNLTMVNYRSLALETGKFSLDELEAAAGALTIADVSAFQKNLLREADLEALDMKNNHKTIKSKCKSENDREARLAQEEEQRAACADVDRGLENLCFYKRVNRICTDGTEFQDYSKLFDGTKNLADVQSEFESAFGSNFVEEDPVMAQLFSAVKYTNSEASTAVLAKRRDVCQHSAFEASMSLDMLITSCFFRMTEEFCPFLLTVSSNRMPTGSN